MSTPNQRVSKYSPYDPSAQCCFIGCNKPATKLIYSGSGLAIDDYTHSCDEHVVELGDFEDVVEELSAKTSFFVRRIDGQYLYWRGDDDFHEDIFEGQDFLTEQAARDAIKRIKQSDRAHNRPAGREYDVVKVVELDNDGKS